MVARKQWEQVIEEVRGSVCINIIIKNSQDRKISSQISTQMKTSSDRDREVNQRKLKINSTARVNNCTSNTFRYEVLRLIH